MNDLCTKECHQALPAEAYALAEIRGRRCRSDHRHASVAPSSPTPKGRPRLIVTLKWLWSYR